jgi:hypothetical protein
MMKKLIKLTSTALLSSAIVLSAGMVNIPVHAMNGQQSDQEIELNSPFSVKGLQLPDNMFTLNHVEDDLTGDGEIDTLFVIGNKENKTDIFATDITFVLKDGKTNQYVKASVGALNAGYEPTIMLRDFNGDGLPEVLLSLANGGSGGTYTYSLFSFKGGEATPVVEQEKLNEGLQFSVTFKDSFKAEIVNKQSNEVTTVDISYGKEGYIESGIYDKAGKLLKNVEGWADGYGVLEPVYQAGGTFALEGQQSISGAYHADRIATAYSTWVIEDGRLKLLDADVRPIDRVNMPSERIQVNSPFTAPGIDLAESTLVLDAKYADVTGDGAADDVLLIGQKESEESIYVTDIRVAIKDGKTGGYTIASVGEWDGGYEPHLFIGNFNDGRTKDIFVSIATGGSGGTSVYSLLTYDNHQLKPLVPQDALMGVQYDVQFKDQFKLDVINKQTNETVALDLSSTKAMYIEMGIYDERGKLLKATEGMVDPFGVLQPIDLDHDGIYELKGLQRISGAYHADGIADAESTWAFKNGKLQLLDDNVVPLKRS